MKVHSYFYTYCNKKVINESLHIPDTKMFNSSKYDIGRLLTVSQQLVMHGLIFI